MFDMPRGRFELALRGAGPALQIDPDGEPMMPRPPVAALPANPRLPREIALERAQQVRVTIAGATEQGFALNGVGGADWPEKPLFKAARGAPVSLTLVNQTSNAQTLRLEGHVARQLHALDDGWDPYWRDALLIGAGKTLHAAFIAAAPGKWPLASASPERRTKGMKAWFWVT
jgi:FtsP/CotA-like multicopper oxidase with cupredoxin domain